MSGAKGLRPVKDSREPTTFKNSILGDQEEEVSGGPRFEKMGVAALNMIILVSYGI